MEQTENRTRSALYEEIYKIVKQIPMKQVETDAMDAPSASYLLEQLFKKWQQHAVMQAEGSEVGGAAVASGAVGKGVCDGIIHKDSIWIGSKRYCPICDETLYEL